MRCRFSKKPIEVQAPAIATAHSNHPSALKFRSKHLDKPVPPVTHRFVADLDPALMQRVFYVAQLQRKPNEQHHHQADDLRAGVEIAEPGALGHELSLPGRPDRLPKSSSDKAQPSAS
jgi:hypothetical protein